MDHDELPVTVMRDSPVTARVSPLVVRDGNSTRLVFLPQLVVNESAPHSPVKGTLIYQRKRPSGAWQPVESIPLSSLRADEGVKLTLDCSEIAKLRDYLNLLAEHFEGHGLVPGQRKYVLVDDRSPVLSLREALESTENGEAAQAVLEWLSQRSLEALSKHIASHGDSALALDAAVGVARLTTFVREAQDLMCSEDEGAWQALLSTQSWAISQLYAEPLVFLQGQAYLGGKNMKNQGGSVADFLYGNSHTNNCLIVEIKTPGSRLIHHDKYERNNSINVSQALSGVVQQVLGDRAAALREYDMLARDGAEPIDPKMLVVIGTVSSLTVAERESFERYRQNLARVRVVAFDEMIDKASTLLQLLREQHA